MAAKLAKALDDLGCKDKELSVLLTDDARIRELNERYRGKSGATNVLSFPQTEGDDAVFATDMLGDVVVSVETAAREATIQGCSLESRVYRLLCHGLLHLVGNDHEKSEQESSRFFAMEERLVNLQCPSQPAAERLVRV
jgi:rRNA maturation RNase YbeY